MKKINKIKFLGIFISLSLILALPTFGATEKQADEIDQKEETTDLDEDYNSPRSNRSINESDDGNGDGSIEDEVEIETKEVDKASPKLMESAPGQDYNSSRSNKPSSEVLDEDSDGDGIEDGTEEEVDTEAAGNGKVYSWGKGLSIATEKVEENDASETAVETLKELEVNAEEVRGGNEEEKERLRKQLEEEGEETTERRVGRIAEMVINNDRLGDIKADEEKTEIKYRARMKVFGFIPVEREINASMDNKQKVEMNYPWYSFLSTRPDEDEVINTLSEIFNLKKGSNEE